MLLLKQGVVQQRERHGTQDGALSSQEVQGEEEEHSWVRGAYSEPGPGQDGCRPESMLDQAQKRNYKPEEGENETKYKEGSGWAP